jgi:hypothetical protein
MSLLCGTVAECAAVAEYAMTPYRRYYADGDIKHRYRCACLRNVTDAAMQRVMPGNATAIAHAYYDACDNADHRPPAERMHYVEGQHWCGGDYVGYFNRTWLPAVHSLGQACRTMHRIGAPLNIKDGSGDGGKTLCEAERLLSPPGCLVVSVGISSDTRFESNLHQFQPNCRVIGYDGTLTPAMTAAVPSFVELRPTNFAIDSWKNFTRRAHVNLLKIEFDGATDSNRASVGAASRLIVDSNRAWTAARAASTRRSSLGLSTCAPTRSPSRCTRRVALRVGATVKHSGSTD